MSYILPPPTSVSTEWFSKKLISFLVAQSHIFSGWLDYLSTLHMKYVISDMASTRRTGQCTRCVHNIDTTFTQWNWQNICSGDMGTVKLKVELRMGVMWCFPINSFYETLAFRMSCLSSSHTSRNIYWLLCYCIYIV